uniref:SANT domain-containing protein n=1 Tax=Panagrellus redivivus TaxID=6233 RepID=A0A7E4W4M8_PANRE
MHDLNGSGQCLLQQASSSQPNLRSEKVTNKQVILSQDTAGTSQQCDNALGSTTTNPPTTQPVFSSSTNPAPLLSSNPDSQPQSQFPIDVTNRYNSTDDEAAARAFQMRLQAKPNAYNTIIHGADIPKRSTSRKPTTGQRKPIPTSSDAATKSSPRKPKPRPSPKGAAPKRQRSSTVTAKSNSNNSTPSTSKSPSRPPATKLKKPNTDKDLRNPLYVSIDPENGTTVPVQQKGIPVVHRKVGTHVNPAISKAINGVDVIAIDDTASPSISNTDTTSMDNSPISVSEQCGYSEATTSSPASNLSTTLTEDDKSADKHPAAESAVSSVQSAEEPMQYSDNDTLTYENPVPADSTTALNGFDPELRSMPDKEGDTEMSADQGRKRLVKNALSVLTPWSNRVPVQQEYRVNRTVTKEEAVAQPSVMGPSGAEIVKQLVTGLDLADTWGLEVPDKVFHNKECADQSFSYNDSDRDEPLDVVPDPTGLYKPDEFDDDIETSEASTRVNSRASVEIVEPEASDDSSVEIVEPEASDDSSVEILSSEGSSEESWTSDESSSDEESDSTPYCSDGEFSPVSYLSDGDSSVQYLSDSDEESETPADAADKESETAADVAEEEGETAADEAEGETASVICLSDEEEESSDEESTKEDDLSITPDQVAQIKQRFNLKTYEEVADKITELQELALEAEELRAVVEEQKRQAHLSPKKPDIPRRQMPKLPPKYVGKPKHKKSSTNAPVVFKKHIIKKHPMERIYGERMTAEDRAYMRIRRVTRATCRNYIKRWMPNPFETKWYKQAKFMPRTQPQRLRRVVVGKPGELPTFRPIEDVPVPSPPKQNIVKPSNLQRLASHVRYFDSASAASSIHAVTLPSVTNAVDSGNSLIILEALVFMELDDGRRRDSILNSGKPNGKELRRTLNFLYPLEMDSFDDIPVEPEAPVSTEASADTDAPVGRSKRLKAKNTVSTSALLFLAICLALLASGLPKLTSQNPENGRNGYEIYTLC